MRAAAVAALAAAALAAPRVAAADPMPLGRVSGQVGMKAGTGAFAARLGTGFAFGFEAAYQPLGADQSIGLGLSWSTTWSYYGAGSARVADSLAMLEMAAGVRVRVPLGAHRRQVLFLGGGGAIIRANEPPVGDGDRTYLGPWAAAGVEFMLLGAQVGVEARYVLARSQDGTLGAMLSIGFGT
ncbi:MAG TPA: hypothetical protein VHE35_20145 [Kofleriaceae bacterium]|nr:hypothetical protein [Kofleriaceae bacterium]